MNSTESHSSDDSFVESLAAYHLALAEGIHSETPSPTPSECGPALAQRLETARNCVRLLHDVWPTAVDINREESSHQPATDADSIQLGTKPAKLGRFEIERELGYGAHGVVFLARDTVLDRKVALKIPRPETLITTQLRRRFLREAQAASSLNHPNLVCVFESGEIGPVCYITQEYCPGNTLDTWLHENSQPVDPRQAAALMATLAEAIDYAHQHGVLHRDLKPGNVILTSRLDGCGQKPREADLRPFIPKVADFGLAKLIEGDGDETRSGMLIGTPLYMAPEQADGRHDEIGPMTDVYGLGVILYELLTRCTPFHGGTPVETIRRVVSDEPVPPSRLCRAIPHDLEAICLKCLEKVPVNRYSSADELAQDLHRFLAGEPTIARPVRLARRLYKLSRRRPALAGLVSVSVLATLVLLIGGWWHAASLQTALKQVERQREEALEQESLAREREQRVRQYLYASDMSHAFAAWNNHHVEETVNLLERHRPQDGEEDLRGFIWRYLWRLSHNDLMTLSGHMSDVHALAFSPDGRILGTVSHDGTAKLWNATTGQELATLLEGHKQEVNAVAFSPDGQTLATGSDECAIRLWDAVTGEQIVVLEGHSESVYALAYSPDGTMLASGGPDQLVKLWDLSTGENVVTLVEHQGAIESLAFSPVGNALATASGDGTAILWDLDTRRPQFILRGHENVVRSVAFANDGQTLATGSDDRTVRIWDAVTGAERATLQGHGEVVQSVAFSADDGFLATAVKDGTVQIWDVETTQPVRMLRGHTGRVWDLAYSPDGTKLATAGGDGTAKLWTISADANTEQRTINSGSLLTLAILPTNNCLATLVSDHLGSESRLNVWGMHRVPADESTSRILPQNDGATRAGVFASDGESLAVAYTAYGDNRELSLQVRIYETSSGELQKVLSDGQNGEGKAFGSSCIAWTPDHTRVAVGRDNGMIDLWNVADETKLNTLLGHTDTVNALTFSPDGRILVSAGEDQSVRFWRLDAPAAEMLSGRHRSGVLTVAFTSDGHLMATAGKDRTIALWDPATATILATLQSHESSVDALAFSPDGKTLASGAEDGILKLWDVPTREEVLSLRAHESSVKATAFSADGTLLATGGYRADGNCEIMLWRGDCDCIGSRK